MVIVLSWAVLCSSNRVEDGGGVQGNGKGNGGVRVVVGEPMRSPHRKRVTELTCIGREAASSAVVVVPPSKEASQGTRQRKTSLPRPRPARVAKCSGPARQASKDAVWQAGQL